MLYRGVVDCTNQVIQILSLLSSSQMTQISFFLSPCSSSKHARSLEVNIRYILFSVRSTIGCAEVSLLFNCRTRTRCCICWFLPSRWWSPHRSASTPWCRRRHCASCSRPGSGGRSRERWRLQGWEGDICGDSGRNKATHVPAMPPPVSEVLQHRQPPRGDKELRFQLVPGGRWVWVACTRGVEEVTLSLRPSSEPTTLR